ncbi:MAG TPA: PAS domain S-box protein [Terracidiphilus sp.]|nr:PAS domain S-box protein [Terracidiphilus sp.]
MSPAEMLRNAAAKDERVTHLSALLDSTHDIIFSLDRDLALVAYNQAFADHILQTWGIQAAPGMNPFDLPSRQRAEAWHTLLSRALNKGAFLTEVEFADGRWVEASLNPVHANGGVIGVSVFARDITERKLADVSLREAESALRESEELFRSFFQLPLVGFSIVHPGKPGIIANERLCQMFGYSADELSVMSWNDITHPDDLTKSFTQFDQLVAGQIRSYSLEKRYIRKDGSILWASVAVGCVKNPDGTVKQVCGYLEDISERRAAEEAVRKAEHEYRQIFEQAPEGIFKTTPGGKALSVNPAGANILGFSSAEEVVGAVADCAHQVWMYPEDRVGFVVELEERGEIHDLICQLKRKDGSPVWVAVSARRVAGEDGKALYYQGYFADVSEKKRLETELNEHLREVKVLSEMNKALLNAKAEEDLLKEYCRIAVETGGYSMAWVGFAKETPEKIVVPVAWFGHEDGYLSDIKVTWDGGEFSHGPTGRACITEKIQVAKDFEADPSLAPFWPKAAKRGFKASIAIPFRPTPDSIAVLTIYGSTRNAWTASERRLMDQVASALGYGVRTLRDSVAKERYQRDLHHSLEQTIQVIADTVDRRDPYTAGHQIRVADLSVHIARKLGLTEERVHGLRLAASIHDLGKVGIPVEILTKPGRLSPLQLDLVKEHVEIGYEIIKDVRFPWPIADIVRQHHERLNGSGYPLGLSGDAILLESRILAVADVVEAMATHRPYRPSRGIDAALEEVDKGRGTLYDSDAVDACIRVFHDEGYQLPG